jgi:hypothetical protein
VRRQQKIVCAHQFRRNLLREICVCLVDIGQINAILQPADRAPLTTPRLFGNRDVGPHREIALDVMPGISFASKLTFRCLKKDFAGWISCSTNS